MLAAGSGQSDSAVARELEVNRTPLSWDAAGSNSLDGLWEIAPGGGTQKPTYGPEKVASIKDATLRTKPEGMTQWSCRLMAASPGVSKSTTYSSRPTSSSPIRPVPSTQPNAARKR